MKNKKMVFIFTTTRADYGLLRWIINRLQKSSEFESRIIVGGEHLSGAYGYTMQEILEDDVEKLIQVPFLGGSMDATALISSVGNGLIQISQVFSANKPDFLVLLGDRYELFIMAIAGLIHRVPIIHLHSGEVTEGVIDEQVRHAITKMSHIHMVAAEFYAENVSKMGEEDWRIHIIGATGLENMKRLKLYTEEEIRGLTGVNVDVPTLVCTYHPVTLESEENMIWQVGNLLKALSKFEIQIVFTKPNAEVGSDKIVKLIEDFVAKNKNTHFFDSLGSKLYLSFLRYAKAVVGNSSSGIIEAPSLRIPTMNVGTRQKGRLQPESVIQTGYSVDEITEGLKRALHEEEFLKRVKRVKNPYGDGNASEYVLRAMEEISQVPEEKLLKKTLDFEVRKTQWHTYF